MNQNRYKLKFAAGIALIFFVGVLAGVLGAGIYFEARIEKMFHHGPPKGKMILMRLTEDLELTPTQIEEIGPIVERFEEKVFEIKKRFSPQMKPLLDQFANQIRGVLNSEQRSKFDAIREKMQKRFPKGPPFLPHPPRKHGPPRTSFR